MKQNETLIEDKKILKDRVKHLESLIEILDVEGTLLTYEPNFECWNHKTVRNGNGNLITYYIK